MQWPTQCSCQSTRWYYFSFSLFCLGFFYWFIRFVRGFKTYKAKWKRPGFTWHYACFWRMFFFFYFLLVLVYLYLRALCSHTARVRFPLDQKFHNQQSLPILLLAWNRKKSNFLSALLTFMVVSNDGRQHLSISYLMIVIAGVGANITNEHEIHMSWLIKWPIYYSIDILAFIN